MIGYSNNIIENFSLFTSIKKPFTQVLSKAKDVVKKNPMKAVMAVGLGAGALGIAAESVKDSEDENNTQFTITSLENTSSGICNIKFTNDTQIKIIACDTIILNDTNTVPPLQGEFTIKNIISLTEIEINIPTDISNSGTTGSMTLKTTVSCQAGKNIGNVAKAAGQEAGKAVHVVAAGAGNIASSGISGMLGISKDTLNLLIRIFSLITCIYFIILGLYKIGILSFTIFLLITALYFCILVGLGVAVHFKLI